MQKSEGGGMLMKLRVSRGTVVLLVGAGIISLFWWRSGDRLRVTEGLREAAVAALAALCHEVGHMLAAWGCRVPVKSLQLDIFGARMYAGGFLSYRREWSIAAAGPLANLLGVALCHPVACEAPDSGFGLFCAASLGLAAVNLLPVRSLDGGRMLRCTVAPLWGERAAERILAVTTASALGCLWLLSVYALLRAGEMLGLFVFSFFLLLRLGGGE